MKLKSALLTISWHLKQLFIALDQLANTILGGWCDETLSARVWRERCKPAIILIDALFFWQRHHCCGAYLSERKRKQLPRGYQ